MKKRKLFIATLLLVFGAFCVFYLIPNIAKARLTNESPKFLKMNGYSVIKDNGFNYLKNQEEYVVMKDSIQDTIVVRLVRGALIIQSK